MFLFQQSIKITIPIVCLVHLVFNLHAQDCTVLDMKFSQNWQYFSTNTCIAQDEYDSYIRITAQDHELDYIVLENLHGSMQLTISSHTDNPCTSDTGQTHILGAGESQKLVWSEGMHSLRLKSSQICKYRVKTIYKQVIGKCDQVIKRFNDQNFPTELSPLLPGLNCFDICTNTKSSNLLYETNGIKTAVNSSVRWLKIPVDEVQMIIKTSVQSSRESSEFYIYWYGIVDDKVFFVNEFELDNEGIIMQADDYDYILLGIANTAGYTDPFTLCLKKFPFNTSCTDFFDQTGQDLRVIYTSKGSSFNGPYLFGEKVTFEYNLNNWIPINENWVHGIVLDYGVGWKNLLEDQLGRPEVILFEEGKLDTIPVDLQLELLQEDTLHIENLSTRSLIIPGWYHNLSTRGPSGDNPKLKWGQESFRIREHHDVPLYTFQFTLIADSLPECDLQLDAYVGVKPIPDSKTGRWYQSGCEDIPTVEAVSYISCCNYSPEHTFQDSLLCSGSSYDFTSNTLEQCTYEIVNSPKNTYPSGEQDYKTLLKLSNTLQEIDTLQIVVTWVEESCEITYFFELLVKPEGQIKNKSIDDTCDNPSAFDLTQYLVKQSGDETIVPIYPEHLKGNILQGINGSHTISSKEKLKIDLEFDSEAFCYNPTTLDYNPKDCDTNNEYFSFVISPNPATSDAFLLIDNQTEHTDWMLSIRDGKGFLIQTLQLYIPPNQIFNKRLFLDHLRDELYQVSIESHGVIASQTLIKTN